MARRRKAQIAQAAVVGLQPDGQPRTKPEKAPTGSEKQNKVATIKKKEGERNNRKLKGAGSQDDTPSPDITNLTTTSSIASSPTLGHKLRLLLLDLTTLNKNPSAARRLDHTLSTHYISAPYFTPAEAAIVLNATIDVEVNKTWRDHCENLEAKVKGKRFEDGVMLAMEGFLEKRRKSGDARPCGPHHIGPLYAGLFGVRLEELEGEGFLVRARREGFGGRGRKSGDI